MDIEKNVDVLTLHEFLMPRHLVNVGNPMSNESYIRKEMHCGVSNCRRCKSIKQSADRAYEMKAGERMFMMDPYVLTNFCGFITQYPDLFHTFVICTSSFLPVISERGRGMTNQIHAMLTSGYHQIIILDDLHHADIFQPYSMSLDGSLTQYCKKQFQVSVRWFYDHLKHSDTGAVLAVLEANYERDGYAADVFCEFPCQKSELFSLCSNVEQKRLFYSFQKRSSTQNQQARHPSLQVTNPQLVVSGKLMVDPLKKQFGVVLVNQPSLRQILSKYYFRELIAKYENRIPNERNLSSNEKFSWIITNLFGFNNSKASYPVFIPSKSFLYPAFHGDIVEIQLLPFADWSVKGFSASSLLKSCDMEEKDKDLKEDDSGQEEEGEENEEEEEGEEEMAYQDLYDAADDNDEDEDVFYEGVAGELSVQSGIESRHVLARVTRIVRETQRDLVCIVNSECDPSKQYVIATPMDRHYPRIMIFTQLASTLLSMRVVVRLAGYRNKMKRPYGLVLNNLGSPLDFQASSKSLLYEYQLENHLVPLPLRAIHSIIHIPPELKANHFIPFQPSQEDMVGREDIRESHRVLSIDPIGCVDIDDALSIRWISRDEARIGMKPDEQFYDNKDDGDVFEVGIHIADVTYYVPLGSSLDLIARNKCTSVYMVDRRYDMLPAVLSSNVCSIRSKYDRLAVSVFIYVDPSTLNMVRDPRVSRTVIRSRYSLAYPQAQQLANTNKCDSFENPYADARSPYSYTGAPVDPEDFEWLSLDIRALMKVGRDLRSRRRENGAVEINVGKITFNQPSTESINLLDEAHLEIHETIEEMMVLANSVVAQVIYRVFPSSALLRVHEPPPQEKLESIKRVCTLMKLPVETTLPRVLLSKATAELAKGIAHDALMIFFRNSMSEAKYVCSQEQMDLSSSDSRTAGTSKANAHRHFGLGIEFYTHFTSPIRRYADIIVHHLLMKVMLQKETFGDVKHAVKPVSRAQQQLLEMYKQTIDLMSIKSSAVSLTSVDVDEHKPLNKDFLRGAGLDPIDETNDQPQLLTEVSSSGDNRKPRNDIPLNGKLQSTLSSSSTSSSTSLSTKSSLSKSKSKSKSEVVIGDDFLDDLFGPADGAESQEKEQNSHISTTYSSVSGSDVKGEHPKSELSVESPNEQKELVSDENLSLEASGTDSDVFSVWKEGSGGSSFVYTSKSIGEICDRVNIQHRRAKNVSAMSSRLFLVHYVRLHQPLKQKGMITRITPDCIKVLVPFFDMQFTLWLLDYPRDDDMKLTDSSRLERAVAMQMDISDSFEKSELLDRGGDAKTVEETTYKLMENALDTLSFRGTRRLRYYPVNEGALPFIPLEFGKRSVGVPNTLKNFKNVSSLPPQSKSIYVGPLHRDIEEYLRHNSGATLVDSMSKEKSQIRTFVVTESRLVYGSKVPEAVICNSICLIPDIPDQPTRKNIPLLKLHLYEEIDVELVIGKAPDGQYNTWVNALFSKDVFYRSTCVESSRTHAEPKSLLKESGLSFRQAMLNEQPSSGRDADGSGSKTNDLHEYHYIKEDKASAGAEVKDQPKAEVPHVIRLKPNKCSNDPGVVTKVKKIPTHLRSTRFRFPVDKKGE